MSKKQFGQFFTIYNPFKNRPFLTWYDKAMEHSKNKTILEPFAGANNLIKTLSENRDFEFKSYDIEPKDKDVIMRDTLKSFPKNYDIVITNPPYLAKNSAKRSGLFSGFKYDDLYKDCLEKVLDNVGYAAAIVPASFLHWGKMKERLYGYVMLTEKMFDDTDTPVCLALFTPEKVKKTLYYLNNKKIPVLRDELNYGKRSISINFNKTETANLGMYTFDNTTTETIKFVNLDEIDLDRIKHSSRNIVSISVDATIDDEIIKKLNNKISEYRTKTQDLFMTPFKGVRKDGKLYGTADDRRQNSLALGY